jgi:hypothetical protein
VNEKGRKIGTASCGDDSSKFERRLGEVRQQTGLPANGLQLRTTDCKVGILYRESRPKPPTDFDCRSDRSARSELGFPRALVFFPAFLDSSFDVFEMTLHGFRPRSRRHAAALSYDITRYPTALSSALPEQGEVICERTDNRLRLQLGDRLINGDVTRL